jgi:hypothetical protein
MIYCSGQYAQLHHFENYIGLNGDHGQFCFTILEGEAISLPRSPIGGIQFTGYKENDFIADWASVERRLADHGAQKVLMTIAPNFYDFSIPKDWLVNFGYRIQTEEITHFLPLFGTLESKIHPMEIRILHKGRSFSLANEGSDTIEEVHDFISRCRKGQGLTINIDQKTLRHSFKTLPDQYQVFTARLDGELISAVIMVEVNDKVAYYFLPATDPEFKQMSPMVHLIQYIYTYYQNKGFKLIDLGISSENGIAQTNLITFKERMGGIKSSRYTFQKALRTS